MQSEAKIIPPQSEALGIFYQHRIDPKTPIETVTETVAALIKEGKVLGFGLCEVNADTIRRAHVVASTRTTTTAKPYRASNTKFVAALDAFGRPRGLTSAQVALAWMLNKEPFIVPIAGTTKIAHLEENLRASDVKFSPDEMLALENTISKIPVVGSRYDALQESKVQK